MAIIPAKPRTTPRPAKSRAGTRPEQAVRLAPKNAARAASNGSADAATVAPWLSSELAGAMFDAMDEGVVVFDLDLRPIYCNQRCIEITGLTLEDHLTHPIEQFVERMIKPDGSPETLESLPSRIVLETGQSLSVTRGIYKPDGDLRWLEVNAAPIHRSGRKELFACCLVMRDVTEQRNAVEALKTSEEMKGAVIATSVDAILTIDGEGEIIDMNRAAEHLYATTDAAIGDNIESFIPWREREVWQQILERLRSDPKHFSGRRLTGTGQRSDGSEFPLEATIDSLDAGGHQLFVAFVRDVTERRAAERRLADARDAALRASVVKSEFLATMSHEIRTPMNGVIGSLDLILDSDLADDLRELATIARTSAHDLLAIIDDILDLSKIEADKLDSQAIEFDLAAIVEGVTDIVAVPARRKRLSLSCFVDPAAPKAVYGDARLLRQVLVNLVGNAVKFTDSGEVAIRAEVGSLDEDRVLVHFAVSDSGIGIPPDSLDKLFEPFTQVDGSSTRAHGGTGLGLAICSRLVRLMGGELGVDSAVGSGSTFSFTVPFEVPERAALPAYPREAAGRPLRVLVVESTPSAADTVERYLRAWGLVTARTAAPGEAIEVFKAAHEEDRFDVAVIAVPAGDASALELARELHELAGERDLFVIALVDIGERLDEAAPGEEQIFDAVVAKPIKQSRLYDALASFDRSTAAPAPAEGEAVVPELRGMRVLIAEDNPVNQLVLTRQAGRLGLVVIAVENGEAAVEALAEGTYDAVLMDCQMPVMDGYAATRAIRELERKGGARTPIVAVTANAMREDYDRCRDAGMDDFVTKPVTLAALANAIERAVAANRAEPDTRGIAEPNKPAEIESRGSNDDLVIDRAALAALQEDLGGAAALARIVQLFLEQLDPQAGEINAAVAAGDQVTAARIAHRMKSSSATLGATVLAELLAGIESAASDGDGVELEKLTPALGGAVERVRGAFEGVVEGLGAAN
jgi:two-component system sensor histidine kinase/response regulator